LGHFHPNSPSNEEDLRDPDELGALNLESGPPPATVAVNESSLRLELSNGSRIISLPASDATVRGYSNCSLLIIDEAPSVPDALIGAITPSLAVSDGRLIGAITESCGSDARMKKAAYPSA
jgi:hypothetical protein